MFWVELLVQLEWRHIRFIKYFRFFDWESFISKIRLPVSHILNPFLSHHHTLLLRCFNLRGLWSPEGVVNVGIKRVRPCSVWDWSILMPATRISHTRISRSERARLSIMRLWSVIDIWWFIWSVFHSSKRSISVWVPCNFESERVFRWSSSVLFWNRVSWLVGCDRIWCLGETWEPHVYFAGIGLLLIASIWNTWSWENLCISTIHSRLVVHIGRVGLPIRFDCSRVITITFKWSLLRNVVSLCVRSICFLVWVHSGICNWWGVFVKWVNRVVRAIMCWRVLGNWLSYVFKVHTILTWIIDIAWLIITRGKSFIELITELNYPFLIESWENTILQLVLNPICHVGSNHLFDR